MTNPIPCQIVEYHGDLAVPCGFPSVARVTSIDEAFANILLDPQQTQNVCEDHLEQMRQDAVIDYTVTIVKVEELPHAPLTHAAVSEA